MKTKIELTAQEIRQQKKYPNTDTFTWYNANPKHKITGDCVIRAIAKATGSLYLDVYDELCAMARKKCTLPNDDAIYPKLLERCGFIQMKQPRKEDNTKYTTEEFAKEHQHGTYVLRLAHHLTCCIDGVIYDIWNCGHKTVGKYWEKR